jgi:hypothetical protein
MVLDDASAWGGAAPGQVGVIQKLMKYSYQWFKLESVDPLTDADNLRYPIPVGGLGSIALSLGF